MAVVQPARCVCRKLGNEAANGGEIMSANVPPMADSPAATHSSQRRGDRSIPVVRLLEKKQSGKFIRDIRSSKPWAVAVVLSCVCRCLVCVAPFVETLSRVQHACVPYNPRPPCSHNGPLLPAGVPPAVWAPCLAPPRTRHACSGVRSRRHERRHRGHRRRRRVWVRVVAALAAATEQRPGTPGVCVLSVASAR